MKAEQLNKISKAAIEASISVDELVENFNKLRINIRNPPKATKEGYTDKERRKT